MHKEQEKDKSSDLSWVWRSIYWSWVHFIDQILLDPCLDFHYNVLFIRPTDPLPHNFLLIIYIILGRQILDAEIFQKKELIHWRFEQIIREHSSLGSCPPRPLRLLYLLSSPYSLIRSSFIDWKHVKILPQRKSGPKAHGLLHIWLHLSDSLHALWE